MKIAALSAFAALGITTAAVAQKSDDRAAKSEMPADQSEMMMGGMMGMMNDPEMRKQMKEMMSNCHKMMEAKQDKMPAE